MQIKIPDFSLILLIGAAGSGKSTFAARHFLPTEVISSDQCRAMVVDDETDQNVTPDALELVHFIAAKRLARRRLAVIDATNVRPEDRRKLIDLARQYHALPTAIVFDLPEEICLDRTAARPDRSLSPRMVYEHIRSLRKSLRGLDREGFNGVVILRDEVTINGVTITREPLWCDQRQERGPFDMIGDVHGCLDELRLLLGRLGYGEVSGIFQHPEGRRAVFLGDLVDRGPDSPGVLRLVMAMVAAGSAFAVLGNHDLKLLKKLNGKDVSLTHGLAETMAQLDAIAEPEQTQFRHHVRQFLDRLISHLWLDDGKLVVAHAGMIEAMQGRGSGAVRAFALYGETTGEIDTYGLPVRLDWAAQYRGTAMVVYGHTPTPEPEWVNNTICLDTGCVFGGHLTALRYPERTLVSVPAAKIYRKPVRPFGFRTGDAIC